VRQIALSIPVAATGSIKVPPPVEVRKSSDFGIYDLSARAEDGSCECMVRFTRQERDSHCRKLAANVSMPI
jgi:hypothetical protein